MTTAQIPAIIIERLQGDGCSTGWLMERLGMTRKEAHALVVAAGAYRGHNSQWRLPGFRPTYTDRACGSAPLTGADFSDAGRG